MPRQPSPSCHGLVSPPFSRLGYYKGSRQRIQAPASAAALPSEDARERGRRSRRACRHLTPLAVRNPGWIFLGNVQPVCWTQEDARQCVAMQAAIPPRPLPAYPGTIGRETSRFGERPSAGRARHIMRAGQGGFAPPGRETRGVGRVFEATPALECTLLDSPTSPMVSLPPPKLLGGYLVCEARSAPTAPTGATAGAARVSPPPRTRSSPR